LEYFGAAYSAGWVEQPMGTHRAWRGGMALGAALVLAGCARDEKVTLALDFSSRLQWCYRMSVEVEVGAGSDTATHGTSRARATVCLRASTSEPGEVVVAFEDLELTSGVLHAAEVEHARRRLTGWPVRFRMRDGVLAPLDTAALAEMQFGGWDLYRVVARTVPALPAAPVGVGETWDREYDMPLADALTRSVGHLYQTYTLDSVRSAGDARLACLSWKYTYRVESLADSGGVPGELAAGKGTGSAVLDLGVKALREARVDFRVPGDTLAAPVWRERVEIGPSE